MGAATRIYSPPSPVEGIGRKTDGTNLGGVFTYERSLAVASKMEEVAVHQVEDKQTGRCRMWLPSGKLRC